MQDSLEFPVTYSVEPRRRTLHAHSYEAPKVMARKGTAIRNLPERQTAQRNAV